MASKEERPLRVCDVCAQVDDHPRHVIAYTPGEAPPVDQEIIKAVIANKDLDDDTKTTIVADLHDNTLQLRHMDCCRQAGCPTGDCNGLPDVQGAKLLAHIQKGE